MSELKVLDGQTIFDVILQTGYSLDQTYEFISQNPDIDSINFSFTANPGTIVTYDPSLISPSIPPDTNTGTSISISDVQQIKAFDGQSQFDLILLTYGTLNLAYKFIQDNTNNIDSINSTQIAQLSFNYNRSLIQDDLLFNSNLSKGIVYNTSVFTTTNTISYLLLESGDYLLTEDGFKIIL